MFKRFRDDMKKYWKYAVYSSKAQLKSEIANSYLNWLWWVLDPLCFMLIYVFMFGYVFKSKEQYFAIFVFVGITLWDFFNKCLLQSVKIIKNNKPIVSSAFSSFAVFKITSKKSRYAPAVKIKFVSGSSPKARSLFSSLDSQS